MLKPSRQVETMLRPASRVLAGCVVDVSIGFGQAVAAFMVAVSMRPEEGRGLAISFATSMLISAPASFATALLLMVAELLLACWDWRVVGTPGAAFAP